MKILALQRLERAAQAAARALASSDPKVRAEQFSPVDERPGKAAKSAWRQDAVESGFCPCAD